MAWFLKAEVLVQSRMSSLCFFGSPLLIFIPKLLHTNLLPPPPSRCVIALTRQHIVICSFCLGLRTYSSAGGLQSEKLVYIGHVGAGKVSLQVKTEESKYMLTSRH
jgi:hypothetical protein